MVGHGPTGETQERECLDEWSCRIRHLGILMVKTEVDRGRVVRSRNFLGIRDGVVKSERVYWWNGRCRGGRTE